MAVWAVSLYPVVPRRPAFVKKKQQKKRILLNVIVLLAALFARLPLVWWTVISDEITFNC